MTNECWGNIPEPRETPEGGLSKEVEVTVGMDHTYKETEHYDGDQQFTFLDYDAICACAEGCKLLGSMLKNMVNDRSTLADKYLDSWYGGHREDYDQLSGAQADKLEAIGDELITFSFDLKDWAYSNLLVDREMDTLFESYGE